MELPPTPKRAKPRSRFWLHAIWISALLVVLGPIIGLLGTVFGMLGAFDSMGLEGESDPSGLAKDIHFAFNTTVVGLVVAVPSFVFFIISLIMFFRNPRSKLADTLEGQRPAR